MGGADHVRAWLACACTWLVPAVAHAGGFEFPDLGTLPIGRGTAFVARADTLDAWHYNPAGLAKLPGPNLMVSVNVVHLDSRFERAGSGDMVLPPGNDGILVNDPAVDPNTNMPYAPVRNGKRFGPAPLAVFSWGDVGVPGLALAIGVQPPSGFGAHAWPGRGAQRYTVKNGDFLFVSLGAGIAYRHSRWFSIGAEFLVGMFRAELDVATRQGAAGAALNEEYESDNEVAIAVKDLFVPSGNFGVLSQPLEWLELGVSVRLPYRTKARGKLSYRPGADTPDAVLASKSRVELRQSFPTLVRAGVRFVHRVFDVEADFVYENWKSVKRIDLEFGNPDRDFAPTDVNPSAPYDDPSLLYLDTFGNGTAFTPLIATDVPLDFRDTYSVRLGSDVDVWPEHITIRAGGFWQSSAYPADHRTFSVRFPYTQQFGVGGGITWHALPQLDVTGGYMHVFQPKVVVKNGIVQANAFRAPGDPNKLGNIVNNGTYRASIDLFGLALSAKFFAGRKER